MREVLMRNYYPIEFQVDDDSLSATLPLRIARLTKGQLVDFLAGWQLIENPPSDRAIYRKADSDEQAVDARRNYVVPQSEIRRRRLDEMRPEERAAFDAAERADVLAMVEFAHHAISTYVSLEPGCVLKLDAGEVDAENRPIVRVVSTSAQLADLLSGNVEQLTSLVAQIYAENTLSAEKKRTLRRLSDLTRSSSAPPDPGPTPAATADAAAPRASAPLEAASGHHETFPSTETV